MALKALLVGINSYDETPLRGCVDDVRVMHELLQARYGLLPDNTRLLLEGAATAAAITEGIRWLLQPDDEPSRRLLRWLQPDDEPSIRLFHFSGHGAYVADEDGDEPDGQDECLVPVDHS